MTDQVSGKSSWAIKDDQHTEAAHNSRLISICPTWPTVVLVIRNDMATIISLERMLQWSTITFGQPPFPAVGLVCICVLVLNIGGPSI